MGKCIDSPGYEACIMQAESMTLLRRWVDDQKKLVKTSFTPKTLFMTWKTNPE